MRMHIATNSKYIRLSTTHPASHYIINYSLASCRSPRCCCCYTARVFTENIILLCYYYALLCFACAFIHYNDSSLRFLFAALRRVCVCGAELSSALVCAEWIPRTLLCVCVCFIYASARRCVANLNIRHIHTVLTAATSNKFHA
jgi:hypothetical protein